MVACPSMAKSSKSIPPDQPERPSNKTGFTTIQITDETMRLLRMLKGLRNGQGTHLIVTALLNPALEAEIQLEMAKLKRQAGR